MGNQRSTKRGRTGTTTAGHARVKRGKAKSTAPPARPAGDQPPKLYEKPPQDLIDFVEARTVYIELPPLKKRPKK
jgi:hypothetical protein